MPPNPERRNQILDAAIDILCDDGVGGLTHRQVDSRAEVPAGTTSNYFRTRQALLEATAQRTVDLHWERVELLQSGIGPLSRDVLKTLMIRLLEPDERRGWQVTYLLPDRDGILDPQQVADALRPETVLVSLMHVNNEIGVVQNIAAVGAICERHGGAPL